MSARSGQYGYVPLQDGESPSTPSNRGAVNVDVDDENSTKSSYGDPKSSDLKTGEETKVKKAKGFVKKTLLPVGKLFSNAILPILSLAFYTEIIVGGSPGNTVWVTFVIDLIRFVVCGYYALVLFCCKAKGSEHGYAKRLRAYARIIDEKPGVRFLLLLITSYSLIVMAITVSPDANDALTAYDRDIESRTRLAGLFFGKLALFFGQQLIQNLQGMNYYVDGESIGGHTPHKEIRNDEDCAIAGCDKQPDNQYLRAFQRLMDGVFASMFLGAIVMGMLMLPHLYFKANLASLNGPSYRGGLPVSTSIKRQVNFPDTCEGLSCQGKLLGLNSISVVDKGSIPGLPKTSLPPSDKVFFIDFKHDHENLESGEFVTLPLTMKLVKGKSSYIGMYARVPQIKTNGWSVCVKPRLLHLYYNIQDDDDYYNDDYYHNDDYYASQPPLESTQLGDASPAGVFSLGVQTNSGTCQPGYVKNGTLSYYNLVLKNDVESSQNPPVEGLIPLAQWNESGVFADNIQQGCTWNSVCLERGIKAYNQDAIADSCFLCSPLYPTADWAILMFCLSVMIVVYTIFTVCLPWPRILFYVKEFGLVLVFFWGALCYLFYVGTHSGRQRVHLAFQYGVALVMIAVGLFTVTPPLVTQHQYSDFSSYITQTDEIHFDSAMGNSTAVPDPTVINFNGLCNGIYPCTAIDYLSKAYAYMTFIALVAFVGGYYIQWSIVLLLGMIAGIGCGLKYCCIDQTWVDHLQKHGENLVDADVSDEEEDA